VYALQVGIKKVRDYKPAYDIETLKSQPMLATLDPGAANQLYRSLECQLGLAFNGRTFENISYSTDTVCSPFSTVRVHNTLQAPPTQATPTIAEEAAVEAKSQDAGQSQPVDVPATKDEN